LILIASSFILLYGWVYDIIILKSIYPNWVTVKPSSIISFMLSGAMLCFMNTTFTMRGNWKELAMFTCSVLIVSFMGLILIESLINIHFGFDTLFIEEGVGAINTESPGEPSVISTILFIFLGSVGIAITLFHRNAIIYRQVIGILSIFIGCCVCWGYVIDVPYLILRKEGLSSAMALMSAVLFMILGLGIILGQPKICNGEKQNEIITNS